jgi:translation initiation factor 1
VNKKNKPDSNGFVYSTDPGFQFEQPNAMVETPLPRQQRLRIRLDTRHRAGKVVTLIEGFIGKPGDLEELGKKIKSYCGTGGSAKDGEIIIQGDQLVKVLQWLLKNNYTSSKKI